MNGMLNKLIPVLLLLCSSCASKFYKAECYDGGQKARVLDSVIKRDRVLILRTPDNAFLMVDPVLRDTAIHFVVDKISPIHLAHVQYSLGADITSVELTPEELDALLNEVHVYTGLSVYGASQRRMMVPLRLVSKVEVIKPKSDTKPMNALLGALSAAALLWIVTVL